MSELHDDLRAVARDLLGAGHPGKGGPGKGTVDWRLIVGAGWLGLEAPAAFDGADAGFAEVAVVLEELGRAAACTPYVGAAVLGVGTLLALEPGPRRDALLTDAVSGAVLPVGLGAAAAPVEVARASRGPRLRGTATLVGDAAEADRLLLLATGPEGVPVVADVDRRADGLRVTAQPVLDETRRFGLVHADDVELTDEAVLTFAGDPRRAIERLADRAALAIACDSLGGSEAMLDATVAYARTREQFGRPIGSFQAVKHACADLLVRISVARQLVGDAVSLLADDDPDAGRAVSMAKAYTCAAAVEVAGKAMQLHGGMGYTWESGIHVYLKRATLGRALFGSPAQHRARIARRYI